MAHNKIIAMEAEVTISAAAEGEDAKGPRRFDVVAYTGGALRVRGWELPIVVDLAGVAFGKSLVANLDHDPSKRVGHVTEKTKADGQLRLGGIASAATAARDEVVNSADSGFVWQASIEADPSKVIEVEAGKTVQVNGQSFEGPLYVARKSTLKGFAFVSHGADDNTTVSIAATAENHKESTMDEALKNWIEAMGFDVEALTADQLAGLKANYEGKNAKKKAVSKSTEDQTLETLLANEKAKRDRIRQITEIAASAISDNPAAIETIEALSNLAREGDWEKDKFELELLRATRPQAHPVFGQATRDNVDSKTVEAAICMTAKMDDTRIEKYFDERTLDAAHTRFKHGIGLQELFLMAARMNGYREPYSNQISAEVLRYAFAPRAANIRASGFSTLDITSILSATANKFLVSGWMMVDQAWRSISARRSVRDFKQITSYKLTGGLDYAKVGPDGEIKHGTLGDTTYTNQADTYGRMLAITRKDFINDDLGALTDAPRRLGRGAGLKFNNVFWTAFLNNSAFFVAGNNNVSTGGGSALGTANGAAIAAAEKVFVNQTDEDGHPVGIMPKIILVPPTLHQTAISYMNSGYYVGGSSTVPGANTWVGRFMPVSSPYMENSSYTGYSAAAWYLLADPNDVPVIESCFLNGQETPTVETADADFHQLGVQMRGYHDFGVALQEFRGGVRSAGS